MSGQSAAFSPTEEGSTKMDSQLGRIQTELTDALRRVNLVAGLLPDSAWSARPAPSQWSVAECLIHLNLTSHAFLPLIADAIDKGRESARFKRTRYRMDLVGRLLWAASTISLPIKTTEPFVPARGELKDSVLSEFGALQNQLIGYLDRAEGLDLGKLRIVSPFDARITYNLYSCFRVIPAHQRQHLRQAERVIDRLRTAATSGRA